MKSAQHVVAPVAWHRICKQTNKRLRSRRSSALLLVLGMIVLLSALILAFLTSVSSELNNSQTYANGATVKQLADSATQLVISQVVSATGCTNSTLAWASQPGMIRTYDTSGNPALFYKLYSSSSLITNGASFSPAGEAPPVTWDSANDAGLYTDLNSPVTSGGTNYFPIIDPRALTTSATTSIEGFNYTKAVDQVTLPSDAGGATGQRLPMPVLWIYVLQNGALATPVSDNAGTVTFNTTDPTKVPSATNPIVGRIAFWTDDETCKININTASEGTFWDRPWAHTGTEEKYSTAIPAQDEYQRYPGHPSKTCLSPVLDPILAAPNPAWYLGIPAGTQTTNTNELTAYYSLVPRISPGGTMGGNFDNTSTTFISSLVSNAMPPKADRLYTSPDELLYSPALASALRQTNSALLLANSGLTVPLSNAYLEKAKFFLTAHSRAPEVNLFGKPRMNLWPIQMITSSGTTLRNAKDSLLAFCSTINGKAYYFQRQSTYTGFGTTPPCSSQDQLADWTATDLSGEARNQTLYNYLDQLTQQNIPGFGGTFAAKYPNTRRQILTEMFDTIRSGVNSYSTALTPSYTYTPQLGDSGEGQIVPLAPATGTAAGTRGFGRFATVTEAAIVFYRTNPANYSTNSAGVVLSGPPYQFTPATQIPQIGAVLVLQPYTVSPGLPAWSPSVHYIVTGLDGFAISRTSTPTTWLPMGFPSSPDNYVTGRMEYSGSSTSIAGNTTACLTLKAFFRYAANEGQGINGTDLFKVLGISTSTAPNSNFYPFYSDTLPGSFPPPTGASLAAGDVTFKASNGDPIGTFNFSGGPIAIQIWSDNNGKPYQLLQTVNMKFPPVSNLPIPTTAENVPSPSIGNYDYSRRMMGPPGAAPSSASANQEIPSAQDPRNLLFEYFDNPTTLQDDNGTTMNRRTMDVVRCMQPDPNGPAKGDLRVYAALANVPQNFFTASPNYDSGTNPQKYAIAHTLRDGSYFGAYLLGSAGQYACDMTGTYTAGTSTPFVQNGGYPRMHTWEVAGNLVPTTSLTTTGTSTGIGNVYPTVGAPEYLDGFNPAVPVGLNGAFQASSAAGDWDNMTGYIEDGPYINKPDEGNSDTVSSYPSGGFKTATGGTSITGGYFSRGVDLQGSTSTSGGGGDYRTETGKTFSPNRQVASAVMFGSLPTGIDPVNNAGLGAGSTAPLPWQTLLFCPNPPAGSPHPGFGTPTVGVAGPNAAPPYTTPPDHLFLDLFTMPVVEPYAISEPLSTAGKVNMNYQILPFTYITRDTAVRAVLKSTRLMAIPTSAATELAGSGGATPAYKDSSPCKTEMRYNINPGTETATPPVSDGTLAGFQARFATGDIFHCASEICGIYLVPQLISPLGSSGSYTMSYPAGSTPPTGNGTYAGMATAMATWWKNFLLTGDNTREAPYNDIYPRLTTKSNTYTVHVRVQTLKKIPSTSPTQWVEGTDVVTGEYRGSSLIERYVDTSDPSLPDFTAASSPSVEGYYKIRVVSAKKFSP